MPDAALPPGSVLQRLSRNAVLARGIIGQQVMTTGSGPWDEGDFDNLLRACGITPFNVDAQDVDVLVVGQLDWDSSDLDEVVATRAGGHLRVYSQELFFFSLAAGTDAFDLLSTEELSTFGNDHPALKYLMKEIAFSWPTTDVPQPSKRLIVDFVDGAWPETGVLKHMGYTVGRNGLSENSRHQILDEVMRVVLVAGSHGAAEHVAQWGDPMTTTRLLKTANSLAGFAVLRKRMETRDFDEAIADWESDLEYLRKKYYQPNALVFRWPRTDVPDQ